MPRAHIMAGKGLITPGTGSVLEQACGLGELS